MRQKPETPRRCARDCSWWETEAEGPISLVALDWTLSKSLRAVAEAPIQTGQQYSIRDLTGRVDCGESGWEEEGPGSAEKCNGAVCVLGDQRHMRGPGESGCDSDNAHNLDLGCLREHGAAKRDGGVRVSLCRTFPPSFSLRRWRELGRGGQLAVSDDVSFSGNGEQLRLL